MVTIIVLLADQKKLPIFLFARHPDATTFWSWIAKIVKIDIKNCRNFSIGIFFYDKKFSKTNQVHCLKMILIFLH